MSHCRLLQKHPTVSDPILFVKVYFYIFQNTPKQNGALQPRRQLRFNHKALSASTAFNWSATFIVSTRVFLITFTIPVDKQAYSVVCTVLCNFTHDNICNIKKQLKQVILMFVDPYIAVQFIQKNPTRCNSLSKFIIPYLYEAQYVSGDTPPIIRSLKLHWQPLVLHTWKVVRRVVAGRWQLIFDVRGSVHRSTIHTEKSNKMQQCIKMYYSIFIWSLTCFGRHTAHHQENKTTLAASGFAYVEGC